MYNYLNVVLSAIEFKQPASEIHLTYPFLVITSLQIPTVSVITLTSGLGSLVNLPHKAKRQKFKGCTLRTHAQSASRGLHELHQ